MKNILLLVIFQITSITIAQKNCEYSSNISDSIGTYKETKSVLMHERIFGNNESSIHFSLLNSDGLPSLSVQFIQKSSDFIPAKCIDKNSKIFFQLENGKTITVVAIDKEDCGSSIRNGAISARILTGYFLFLKDNFEDLKTSPIEIMTIKYATETTDYIIKKNLASELSSSVSYNPSTFFIDYLKCIIEE